LRSRHWRVQDRWVGLDAGAKKLQSDVLAQQERARAIYGNALSESVRLVVLSALRQDWLELRGRLALGLGRQRHVQQARRRLPQLLGDEDTLRTSSLEGHAQIIVSGVGGANGAESQ